MQGSCALKLREQLRRGRAIPGFECCAKAKVDPPPAAKDDKDCEIDQGEESQRAVLAVGEKGRWIGVVGSPF